MLFGISVAIETTQEYGQKEPYLGLSMGKDRLQHLEVNTQSIFSRRGEGCMFDQVNFLPCNGISLHP
jgi:hypothetical protein